LNENSELLRLIVQQLKNDLGGTNEIVQSLALSCIGTSRSTGAIARPLQELIVPVPLCVNV
jgi:hypothetical protein